MFDTYPYFDGPLGALWAADHTLFRVWAPTAQQVTLNLYEAGRGGEPLRLSMHHAQQGTWVRRVEGDLNGRYYTYTARVEGTDREVCDPYAVSAGCNGQRSMVLDLRSTDPAGWDTDRDPHYGAPITDAVIYELHLRDVSMHPHAGIRHKGKFLGLAQRGTHTPQGQPTGLDHILSLGVTHVQLLPIYDFGSVDEEDPTAYNWGYDPVSYNLPEGSYATDPQDGRVRVKELKQLIRTLHGAGLSVVMDVVYNHVYDRDRFSFNRLVPGYFSRGSSNGSGCGNDTASERPMVRKFIIDSLCHWAREYHIDGFRFDLAGLLDIQTINSAMEAVHRHHPNVLFYGEGWDMPTQTDAPLATQKNAARTPGFAYFNDQLRDLLRGSVWDDAALGFVTGRPGCRAQLFACMSGRSDWCPTPAQSINYVSCHDNLSLYDRIAAALPGADRQSLCRRSVLAGAMSLLSQGVPFLQAGEELLRTKDGDHNSYKSPDPINAIRWDSLSDPEVQWALRQYRAIIALRRQLPGLRLSTPGQVREAVRLLPTVGDRVFALQQGEAVCVFNADTQPASLLLPPGHWCVRLGEGAVDDGRYTAPPLSASVLCQPTKKS